jgi:hypothetical protein
MILRAARYAERDSGGGIAVSQFREAPLAPKSPSERFELDDSI